MSIFTNPGFRTDYDVGSINKFDFYSGSQITVWFGDILMDDINSIQWARTQNKRPIYGYASQEFDAIARGTVLIQGNFAINFRQVGYLTAVMDEIKNIYKDITGGKAAEEKAKFNSESWPQIRRLIGHHLKNGTFGPTTNQEIKDIGDNPDFLELAKIYEDTIWGEFSAIDEYGKQRKIAADISQSEIIPNGFNILITYGNTSGSENQTLNSRLQSTTKALNGVHLIGESQAIQVGGQPVQEQYNFIARSTDEYIAR